MKEIFESRFGYTSDEVDPEGFLNNPFAFVAAVIRKALAYSSNWRSYERAKITYDDLFHEGVTALYLELQSSKEVEADVRFGQVWAGVLRHLGRFLTAEAGRTGSIQFSQFGDEESEEMEFPTPVSVWEAVELKLHTEAILKMAERVLKSNRHRPEDGQRDFQVFSLYAQGMDYRQILEQCSWMTEVRSVERSLKRSILKLRKELGVDVAIPIYYGNQNVQDIRGEARFDDSSYQKEYYRKNRERLNARSREYMRLKRAMEKAQKEEKACPCGG